MDLRINKVSNYSNFPLRVNSNGNAAKNALYIYGKEDKTTESGNLETCQTETELPIMATANDLREAAKFFKNKPGGVSVVEIMNAEPRRIFDARKIAAYEFWGIIKRDGERLRLTDLGEEFAINTEAECEINRQILRSIPAYSAAVEWIYQQNIKITTFYDVADFWRQSQNKINLSRDNEDNIEAVIVSFFSLCHSAELGTATVGKRGQPARLRINSEQLEDFIKHPGKSVSVSKTPVWKRDKYNQLNGTKSENVVRRVYLAANQNKENAAAALENIRIALELADFEDIAYGEAIFSDSDFLSSSQLNEIQQCEAAVFLLDKDDCISKPNGELELCGVRLAEISVALALLNQRVAILWDSSVGVSPPESLQQMNLHFFNCESFDWESGVSLVKMLKSLRS
ncbi:MAG: hypothetical protein ABI891_13490 [Acidobacteriota bacterium]